MGIRSVTRSRGSSGEFQRLMSDEPVLIVTLPSIVHVSEPYNSIGASQGHREFLPSQDCKIPPWINNIPENSRYWNNHSPSSIQQNFIQLTTLQTCSDLIWTVIAFKSTYKSPLHAAEQSRLRYGTRNYACIIYLVWPQQ